MFAERTDPPYGMTPCPGRANICKGCENNSGGSCAYDMRAEAIYARCSVFDIFQKDGNGCSYYEPYFEGQD